MFYEGLQQVLLGLKEGEKGSQGPNIKGDIQNAVFTIS